MGWLGVTTSIAICVSSAILLYFFPDTKVQFLSTVFKMSQEDNPEKLFQDFWTWRLVNSPEFATCTGNHDFDDILESYSLESFKNRQVAAGEFLERAKVLLGNTQEERCRVNLELFVEELQTFITGLKVKGYLFPINNLEGVHIEFERIISYMVFNTTNDYHKLLSRYNAFPKQVDEIIELMKDGIKQGMTNHIYSMTGVVEGLAKLQLPCEQSAFYKPFLTIPESIPAKEGEELQLKAKSIITEVFLPAFKKLQEFITKEYMKSLRPNISISSLPNGQELYQQCLRFHLSLDLTAEEVHQIGLQEVERITKEMKRVIESIDLKISPKEFSEKIRGDEGFYFKKKEDLVEAYEGILNIITPKLPQIIKNIPQLELSIEPMPKSMAESGPLAYYLVGTVDGSRPGTFYVNNMDVKSSPKYEMMSLSLHEGVPGHHLQASHMLGMQDMPDFLRYIEDRKYSDAPSRFPLHTAFLEGWGLYSEYLGKELGLYEDPYFYYGYLSQEIFRACRLVVDTGMHAMGWSREKAVDFMTKNTAATEKNIGNEINRYITWPGQACAYKVGELKIKMLRKKAEESLGNKFDVREFHEIVLNNTGPLAFLEKQVDCYIKAHTT